LQSLLDSIASHETESARHKGLTLRVRATQAVAWTDPILLEQILRNLVGNAVRHTERGGILVGIRSRGTHVLIQVWDTGAGIAPEDQSRIFDEFVQLNNPGRERRRGLGLGLAIVKRASQLLGYPIKVRSRLGRGSCFGVLVPTSPLHKLPLESGGSSHPDASGPQGQWLNMEVLLIEDDQAVRDALTQLLRGWGFRVTSGSGLSWLLQQASHSWDLVISDHRLSDGSGRDVVQYLRSLRPDLPALIITGDTSPEQINRLAHSGVPVLHKPFRAEKLRAMIEEIMARSDDSVRKLE
ncbi:MAG TPA: ATP-binding protein, partial [Aquabacterium sp.]|nr:ATP-binding protein [Aquabacterium sp.]